MGRPQPQLGELTALPDPVAVFKGTYFYGEGGVKGGEGKGMG